ncbi:MAG: hypothetical protein HZA49_05615 [Planctomycetes bacterium]|nr:hypothetical protein [Planctomycetota bacterium]
MGIHGFYGRGSVWLIHVIILVGGFYWCREIISRLPEDIDTFKRGADRAEKWVTLIYWAGTVVIMALMAYSAWVLAIKIIGFIKYSA